MCLNLREEGKQFFKVVFDNGKPYEEDFLNEEDLKQGLKNFYEENKNEDYPFNASVFDEEGNDITESQFINELVGFILEENEKEKQNETFI